MAKKAPAGVSRYNHARECRESIWRVILHLPETSSAGHALESIRIMPKRVVRAAQLALLGTGFATDNLKADGEVGEETRKSLAELCKFADQP